MRADTVKRTRAERFTFVVTDLHKRGKSPCEAEVLLGEHRARNYVGVEGEKVSYALPAKSDG